MDKIDKQIITELLKNGREPFRKIGRKINISHTAVKKRYDNLVEKDAVKVSCLVNTTAIGITCYIVLLSVIDKHELMKKIKRCNFIRECFETLGEYNLGFIIGAKSIEELDKKLECFLKSDNVKKYRTIPMLCKDNFVPIKGFNECDC